MSRANTGLGLFFCQVRSGLAAKKTVLLTAGGGAVASMGLASSPGALVTPGGLASFPGGLVSPRGLVSPGGHAAPVPASHAPTPPAEGGTNVVKIGGQVCTRSQITNSSAASGGVGGAIAPASNGNAACLSATNQSVDGASNSISGVKGGAMDGLTLKEEVSSVAK